MKKKAVKDFHKKKLKVGKHLPKGKNETDTSFKSKKICIPVRHGLEIPSDTSFKDMLRGLSSRDANIKYDNLRKLVKYVSNNGDTLPMYFPEILKEISRLLLDSASNVREEAIELISHCVDNLTDIQFKSFFMHLTTFLICMMTHSNTDIKLNSLNLLDKLLHSHPKVMCHCGQILQSLLNMISSLKVTHGEAVKKGFGERRVLVDVMSTTMTSEEWRMKVLARIQLILQSSSTIENANEINTDDKEVHWDNKNPLFLPLYINSGAVPAKLDYSWYNEENAKLTDSNDFKQFVFDLVPLLSSALKGEVSLSSEKSSRFRIMSNSDIKHLNIITQVLFCIGECASQIFGKEGDMDLIKNPDFSHQIRFIICYQLIKGFPYTQRTSFIKKYVKKDETECMQLNLAICYLYSMFILNTENATVDMENSILSYMMDVFRVSGTMCEKTIILTLKTSKNFIQSKNVGESFKNGIMLGLYGILEVHRLSPIADLLYSFFMDLSLNYDFKYLVNSEGMIVWFNSLIKNLNFMMESKVVKKSFLKYVEQVCMRRYSHFMELLNSISTKKFIEFLQFDDEEFQLTVIHLIASLDVISSDFLQDICEAITHEDFSLKTASRVICLLHCRFSKPNTSSIDQINFVKFLLNVGCDCLSLESDPEPEKRLPLHDPIMEAQQNCLCSFKIYPTSTAEKHLKIFEVCCDCLTHYIKTEIIPPSILYFMSSLCSEFREFPVHVVIAVMELAKRLPFHYSEELTTAFNKMFFSSAVYLSLVTNEAPEENWSDYVLPQLQNSLDSIDLEPAFKTIEHNISTYGTNDVYLILRVIFFLFESSDTVSMNRNQVYKFMDIVGRTCRHDRTLFSMWVNLCKMV